MSKNSATVYREQVEDWLKMLRDEPHIKGDGIDTVIIELSSMIEQMDDDSTSEALTFENINIGETYKFRAIPETKKYLHNVPVKIIELKQKNVIGKLMQDTPYQKKGKLFSIPPSSLERL